MLTEAEKMFIRKAYSDKQAGEISGMNRAFSVAYLNAKRGPNKSVIPLFETKIKEITAEEKANIEAIGKALMRDTSWLKVMQEKR